MGLTFGKFKFGILDVDPIHMVISSLFVIYSVIGPAQAQVKPDEKIKTITPVEVRTREGQLRTCSITAESFTKWDGRDVVKMKGVKANGCGSGDFFFEKPVTIVAESGARYTIPANRTILYLSERGAQIDVKDDKKGGIAVETGGKHELSDRIYSSFEERKKESAALIEAFQAEIAKKDYSKAREAYSKIVHTHELYSGEIKKIGDAFASIPSSERPLKTYDGDMRPEMEALQKTFGDVDFDKMTLKEYLAFAKDWADHPDQFKGKGDQTYLFRILDQIGVPKESQYDLFYRAYASRMAKVRKAYLAKQQPEFSDTYIIGTCINSMRRVPQGEEFLKGLKANLARLDPKEQDYLGSNIFELMQYLPEKPKTAEPPQEPASSGSGK
jgi:hypothetical protein